MNKKELLDRCARSGEERILLGRVLDKLELAQSRGVPAHTPFLSPGEQASVTDLLNGAGRPRSLFWGGYPGSERNICLFPAGWQEDSFPAGASLTHRDILGALMGLGLTREVLGDILLPQPGVCQVVALTEAVPILLSQWESAGRYKVSLSEISLDQLAPKPAQVRTIRDTVATLRLDAVTAAGFSLSRAKAAALVASGKVSLNHRECLKADRPVAEGDVLTCRGLGRCVVKEVPGQSKKGRTMVVLDRYV